MFGTGGSYAQYPVANGSSTEYAALATSSAPFASIPTSTSLSYGTVVPGAEQTSSAFDQQAYNANEDAAMSASHAAALVAAATPNASAQRTNGSFSYPSIQTPSNASSTNYQLPYNAAIGSHWQQWSQATAATVQRPGDYLNSANTLLPLGSRRGSAQNAGPNVTTSVGLGDGTVLTAATSTTPALNYAVDKWPAVMFPNYPMGPLGHGGQGQSQQPQ